MNKGKPKRQFMLIGTLSINNSLASIRDAVPMLPLSAILYEEGFEFQDILLNREGSCDLNKLKNTILGSTTRYAISELESHERRGQPGIDSVLENYNVAREQKVYRVKSRVTIVTQKEIHEYLLLEYSEYGYISFRQTQRSDCNSGSMYSFKKYQIYYPPVRVPAELSNKTIGYLCYFPARKNAPALLNIFTPSQKHTPVFAMLLKNGVWKQLAVDLNSQTHAHFCMVQFDTNYDDQELSIAEITRKVDYEIILNISFPDIDEA